MEIDTETHDPMTPERATAWVQRYFDGWNSHDAAELLALASDDVVWEDPYIPGGRLEGKPLVRDWLRSIWRAAPDLTFELVGSPFLSLDGRRLAAVWRGRGTFTGPLDPPGFAPTNQVVEITGIDTYDVAGDVLRGVNTATDTMSLGRQIGAAPPAGSRAERFGVQVQRLAARRQRARAH